MKAAVHEGPWKCHLKSHFRMPCTVPGNGNDMGFEKQ